MTDVAAEPLAGADSVAGADGDRCAGQGGGGGQRERCGRRGCRRRRCGRRSRRSRSRPAATVAELPGSTPMSLTALVRSLADTAGEAGGVEAEGVRWWCCSRACRRARVAGAGRRGSRPSGATCTDPRTARRQRRGGNENSGRSDVVRSPAIIRVELGLRGEVALPAEAGRRREASSSTPRCTPGCATSSTARRG